MTALMHKFEIGGGRQQHYICPNSTGHSNHVVLGHYIVLDDRIQQKKKATRDASRYQRSQLRQYHVIADPQYQTRQSQLLSDKTKKNQTLCSR